MAYVGCWGQWFFSILSCPMLVEQHLVVYSRTNLLCHRTSFLLVFHEVRRLQLFLTLQSSVVFHPSYRRCAQTVLTFFSELHIQLCNVFVLFSANLVANSFFLTHLYYSRVASYLKYQHFSGVRYLYCPCFRSIKETRKDTRKPNIKTGFTVNSLLLRNVFNIPIRNWLARLILRLISALWPTVVIFCYQTSKIDKFIYTFEYVCVHC